MSKTVWASVGISLELTDEEYTELLHRWHREFGGLDLELDGDDPLVKKFMERGYADGETCIPETILSDLEPGTYSRLREESVDVICYGQRETWKSRSEAETFYWRGIESCEGSERDRYWRVYQDLVSGKLVATDGYPERRR